MLQKEDSESDDDGKYIVNSMTHACMCIYCYIMHPHDASVHIVLSIV